MQGYLSTGENDYVMLCQPDYFNIGAQGDGPAIHLDKTFKSCSTYKSLTFKNDIITGRKDGRFINDFEIQDLELFII